MERARYRRVVLGTDGSAHAAAATATVGGLAWPAGAEIAVVGVCEEAPPDSRLPETGVEQDARRYLAMVQEEERARAAAAVAAAAAQLRARLPEVTVTEIVRSGEPAAELLAQAGESRAELMVVGARGHTILHGLLLGSISEALVAEAPCPVLIARGGSGVIARVLLAAGSLEDADHLAAVVARLPLPAGTPVVAAAVESPHDDAGAAVVARLAERLAGAEGDREIEQRVLRGETAQALMHEAARVEQTLIVVGARERRGLPGRLGLGSVSRKLVRRAETAVLVVREGES